MPEEKKALQSQLATNTVGEAEYVFNQAMTAEAFRRIRANGGKPGLEPKRLIIELLDVTATLVVENDQKVADAI